MVPQNSKLKGSGDLLIIMALSDWFGRVGRHNYTFTSVLHLIAREEEPDPG